MLVWGISLFGFGIITTIGATGLTALLIAVFCFVFSAAFTASWLENNIAKPLRKMSEEKNSHNNECACTSTKSE